MLSYATNPIRNDRIGYIRSPLLYEDAQGMVEYVSQRFCTMLPKRLQCCYTRREPIRSWRNADRVFYFDEGPRATPKLIAKAYHRAQKSQTTLEVWT